MSTSVFNKLVNYGGVSLTALCLAWGGVAYAGDGPIDGYTSVSKASVKIKYFEQVGEGVSEHRIARTPDVINALTGAEPGTTPPRNLQLVMLSSCEYPEDLKALAVWDKDTDGLAEANIACLGRESSAVYNSSRNRFYQGLDIDADNFGLNEIDMDVEVRVGSVPSRINSNEPVCLKRLRTMAMAGYQSSGGDGADGNKVLRGGGQIKTNGGFKATLPDIDALLFACD